MTDDLESRYKAADVLKGEAYKAHEEQDFDKAATLYKESLALYETTPARGQTGILLARLCQIALQQKNSSQAAVYAYNLQTFNFPGETESGWFLIGKAEQQRNNVPMARHAFAHSVRLGMGGRRPNPIICRTLYQWALLEESAGDIQSAIQLIDLGKLSLADALDHMPFRIPRLKENISLFETQQTQMDADRLRLQALLDAQKRGDEA